MTKRTAGAATHQQQPHHDNAKDHGDGANNHGDGAQHHGGKRRGTYWGLINEAVAKKTIKIDTKTRQLLISALATLILVSSPRSNPPKIQYCKGRFQLEHNNDFRF